MDEDDIAAVRRVRHEISKQFNHNVDQVIDFYCSVQEDLKRSGRFRFAATGGSVAPPLSDAALTEIAEEIFLNLDRDEAEH